MQLVVQSEGQEREKWRYSVIVSLQDCLQVQLQKRECITILYSV